MDAKIKKARHMGKPLKISLRQDNQSNPTSPNVSS
jgi:hypothetical protein